MPVVQSIVAVGITTPIVSIDSVIVATTCLHDYRAQTFISNVYRDSDSLIVE